jgi:zinc protease
MSISLTGMSQTWVWGRLNMRLIFRFLIAFTMMSASVVGATPSNWLDPLGEIQSDPQWALEALPNGVRTAVRHNETPKGQVAIRIMVETGGLNERPEQCGYAHFVEHMLFRKTEHFADGEARKALERIGVDFGAHLNAFTDNDTTIYQIEIPRSDAASVDLAMTVLADMIRRPVFEPGLVTVERGVVLSEERTRATAGSRISEKTSAFLFAGTKLAKGLAIGTPACLNAATAASLSAFHKDWYRPDRVIIAIAGDADPVLLNTAITRHFGDWAIPAKPAPVVDYGKLATDGKATLEIVEPTAAVSATLSYTKAYDRKVVTISRWERDLNQSIGQAIINRRFEKAARDGAPFIGAALYLGRQSRLIEGSTLSFVPVGTNPLVAISAVRGVMAEAMATPPTPTELDFAMSQFRGGYRMAAQGASTRPSAQRVQALLGAVRGDWIVIDEREELDLFYRAAGRITPATVLAETKRLLDGTGPRLVIVAPSAMTDAEAKMRATLAEPVVPSKFARVEFPVSFELLKPLGAPGRVAERTEAKDLGVTFVRFANGLVATLKPTKFQQDSVSISLDFGGGRLSLPTGDLVWGRGGASGSVQGQGIGMFDRDALERMTAGQRLGLNFSVGDASFEYYADTNAVSLQRQLLLFGHAIQSPRWDAAPVDRLREIAIKSYPGRTATPEGAYAQQGAWLIRNRNPLAAADTRAELDMLTAANFKRVMAPPFRDGPLRLVIVGDFEIPDAIDAIAKTLGAVPPRQAALIPAERRTLSFAQPTAAPTVILHDGRADQAMASISWPLVADRDAITRFAPISVMRSIFEDRMNDRLRRELGKTYGAVVGWDSNFEYHGAGGFTVRAAVDVKDVGRVRDIARAIAAELTTTPVDPDALERVRGPLLANMKQEFENNRYWFARLQNAYDHREDLEAIRTRVGRYTSLTAADIQREATIIFAPGRAVAIDVLPRVSQQATSIGNTGAQ